MNKTFVTGVAVFFVGMLLFEAFGRKMAAKLKES